MARERQVSGGIGVAVMHMVPWQAFPAKDGYVVVAAREEKFWLRLCDAIGRPDLKEDPRTRNNTARLENRSFTVGVLEDAFAQKTKAEWGEILDEFDIPAASVNDLPAVYSDPHVLARGLLQTYEHPVLGPIKYTPSPMQFSNWERLNQPAPIARPAHARGAV